MKTALAIIDEVPASDPRRRIKIGPPPRRCFKTGRDTVGVDAKLALPDLEGQYQTVKIKADSENKGLIYVGRVGVTQENGFELGPGEEIELTVHNLNSIYVEASRADQVYCWLVN